LDWGVGRDFRRAIGVASHDESPRCLLETTVWPGQPFRRRGDVMELVRAAPHAAPTRSKP